MTLRIAVLAGAIAFANTAAWAQTPPSRANQPIIYSGLFLVRADSGVGGFAVQTGEHVGADLAGLLYISPCSSMGASNPGHPVSAFATDAWLMSGKVLELTDQQASVQIGWRRIRSGGREDSSPEQVVTLMLKRGERNTLESIAVPASGSCEARNVSLDVVFSSRPELYGIGASADTAGSRAAAGARAGGGAGTGGGTGGGGGIGSGGGGVCPPRDLLGREQDAVPGAQAERRPVAGAQYAGRADETLHITAQVIPTPVAYAFAPLTIQTATGTVTVKVEGTLETGQSPEGEPRLHFTATRNVTSVTTPRPTRDGKPIVEGSTKTTVALPGPDEVLSFEMPPLRTSEGVTLSDRLSIRVRLAPSTK